VSPSLSSSVGSCRAPGGKDESISRVGRGYLSGENVIEVRAQAVAA
jgi:hypothetical protein